MRALLFCLCLTTIACAKPDSADSGASDGACTELYSSAYDVKHPDGVTRKSDVYACSGSKSGCYFVVWVNDSSVNFETCNADEVF